MIRLRIRNPDGSEETIERKGTRLTFGRLMENDVVLKDPRVSRRHCEIEEREGTWILTDLSSTQGTFVDGRMVKRLEVRPGTEIRIGGTRITIQGEAGPGGGGGFPDPFEATRRSRRSPEVDEGLLQRIYNLSIKVASSLELKETLSQVVSETAGAMGTDYACIILREENAFRIRATYPPGTGLEEAYSRSIVERCLKERRPILVKDAPEDPRFSSSESILGLSITTAICGPLLHEGRVIGILYVDNRNLQREFAAEDIVFFELVSNLSALAVANAFLYDRVLREKRALLATEADVMKRLSRDVHDGPAQTTAAVLLKVRAMKSLSGISGKEMEDLEGLELMAERANREMRNVLAALRPLALETGGLTAAVEHLSRNLSMTGDLRLISSVEDFSKTLSTEEAKVLFSIISEAVSNAAKHAEARTVKVEGVVLPTRRRLLIEDDGIGFDPDEIRKNYKERESFGLLNMEERVEILGGRLEIDSRPGEGARIEVMIPPKGDKSSWY